MPKVAAFLEDYEVTTWTIGKEAWDETLNMLKRLNVSACDAIQKATAKVSDCRIFVTNDEKLGKEAKKILTWLRAEEALEEIRI